VLTGAGLQSYTATCNLIGWYFVAAPLALGLTFGLNLNVETGYVLLLSCCAAMFTSFVGQVFLLARHDWQHCIDEAARRMAECGDRVTLANGDTLSQLETLPGMRIGNRSEGTSVAGALGLLLLYCSTAALWLWLGVDCSSAATYRLWTFRRRRRRQQQCAGPVA
jgi:hypothetical protein